MKNPLILMSAITGKPSKEKMENYLSGLYKNGIEQILIYPRSGCEIEYLSDDWFDTVYNFLEIAKGLNMSIWLYDDFNWPSGDAGGKVTKNPMFRLKAITSKGEISCKSTHNSNLFGEKYFPDLLSYEAVDYFIKCTHEEYFKRFEGYFGTVIKGIFTDEPSIGYCCENDSIPYYKGLEKDYLNAYGRELLRDFSHNDFLKNIVEIISERFKSCYIDKLATWCKSHSILMTGHLMCDNDPFGATKHGGRFLENLSSFLLPGVDEIYTSFEDETEMTLFGSIEYASGENGAMAELFALGPCSMPYAKKRAMLYLCACHKIDHYFLAISHLDMRGNMLVKDYFNNFNVDQPDFLGMGLLAECARDASKIAKKDYIADVYIRYPHATCANGITGHQSLSVLHRLTRELTYRQIQWKFLDRENPTDKPIIEINDNFELTIDKKPFDLSLITHTPLVLDKSNHTPPGIFVRRFKDGTYVIINLFAPEGEYFIDGKSTYIYKHDVIFSNCKGAELKKKNVKIDFCVNHLNKNLVRAMFINNEELCTVNCDTDLDATLYVRNGAEIYLNKEKLTLKCCDNSLPQGMRDLYKCARVCLNSGKNTIKSVNDFKYLPSVILGGDFACKYISNEPCEIKLSKQNCSYLSGKKMHGFGCVSFTALSEIPHNASYIHLDSTELYTEVYLNGILLGKKIAPPYNFSIDTQFRGRECEIKIIQYTSISPIFGDTEYWDNNSNSVNWKGTPSSKPSELGFEFYWI